jgi:hypothetical protein
MTTLAFSATLSRPALSQHDLIELLNWELAAYDECRGCHFSSIRRMPDRDDLGCNWLDARVQSDHHLGVQEHFIVRHIIEETRREYDIAP